MKTIRIISGIISVAFCLSALTACSSEKNDTDKSAGQGSKQSTASEQSSVSEASKQNVIPGSGNHVLTVRDPGKNAEMTATFFNNITEATEDVKMQKTDEAGDSFVYTCKGDTAKYNMVHLSYGDTVTKNAAFNECVSGWELFEGELVPYDIKSDKKFELKYDTKTFQVQGIEKNVYIWTPDDYDAKSADKYSTIYMLDGQTVLTTELGGSMRSWNVAQHTASMMSATDNKAILVCLDAGDMRDDDYSPAISDDAECKSSSNPCGSLFANFVCDTVMPYVQENYNVYTDAQHTSLAGSSLGGLESFYAVLSHPESFGTAGVLSPSFWAYVDDTWADFLKDKVKMENAPFLYVYAGSYASDNGENAEDVYNMLLEMGYPKDRMVFNKYEPGEHTPTFWRNIYPEFLQAMFMQKTEALECGVPIQYKDRSSFDDIPRDVSIDPNDPKLKDKNNYIYYDNSETK